MKSKMTIPIVSSLLILPNLALGQVPFPTNGNALSALLWQAIPADGPQPSLSKQEFEIHWRNLGAQIPEQVFAAAKVLIAGGDQTVGRLAARFAGKDYDRLDIKPLIQKLGDNSYRVRTKAAKGLLDIGNLANVPIRYALKMKIPLETHVRLLELLDRLPPVAIDKAKGPRVQCAIHILERISTPSSVKLLYKFGNGSGKVVEVRQARAALARLKTLYPDAEVQERWGKRPLGRWAMPSSIDRKRIRLVQKPFQRFPLFDGGTTVYQLSENYALRIWREPNYVPMGRGPMMSISIVPRKWAGGLR